jgi:hypothetical protein
MTSSVSDFNADVELRDTIGPFNKWKSRTAGAFSSDEGTFTNQTRNVVDVGRD